jgi:hypothetical protein
MGVVAAVAVSMRENPVADNVTGAVVVLAHAAQSRIAVTIVRREMSFMASTSAGIGQHTRRLAR